MTQQNLNKLIIILLIVSNLIWGGLFIYTQQRITIQSCVCDEIETETKINDLEGLIEDVRIEVEEIKQRLN